MELRTAQPCHQQAVMALIDQAKEFLRAQGIDQWQNGYPDKTVIRQDIAAGKGCLLMDNGQTAGYACLDFDGEPAYEGLSGKWLNDAPYLVVHRMAMDQNCRGKGLARKFFAEIEKSARAHGITSLRVDTDEDNHIMRHLLDKMGFTYCGTICFDNSEKIAFQKLL